MPRRSTILALAINKWKGSSGSPACNDNAPCSHGSLESHAVHLVAIGILVIDNPASAYLSASWRVCRDRINGVVGCQEEPGDC